MEDFGTLTKGVRVRVQWAQGFFDGKVFDVQVDLDARNKTVTSARISYDDGDLKWVHPGGWTVWRLPTTDANAEVTAHTDWVPLNRRCQYSFAPLTDPAAGDACQHRGERCNYDCLREYVGRFNKCPIAGCNAPIARSRDIVRDTALKDQLPPLDDDGGVDDDEKWEVRATGAVEVRRKPAEPEVGRKRRRGSD